MVMMWLVLILGGSRLQAWVTGMLFALSGPVIENYYTLSKGEAQQLGWWCGAWLLMAFYARLHAFWAKLLVGLASAFAILCAAASKETTLLLLPISLAWLVTGWLRQRWARSEGREAKGDEEQGSTGAGELGLRAVYCVVVLAGCLGYLAIRGVAVPQGLTSGTYTSGYIPEISRMLSSALRWSGWLIRDFLYLLPLAIAGIVRLGRMRKSTDGQRINGWVGKADLSQQIFWLFDIMIWMGAWVAVYLPWSFAAEYYLLPFAVGAAFFGGALVNLVVEGRRAGGPEGRGAGEKVSRIAIGACLGLALLLFLPTLTNNITTARIQLTVDAANQQMLDYLAEAAPAGSTVLVNIQYQNEYIRETRLHLHYIYNRPDLTVDLFKYQVGSAESSPNPEAIYIVSPEIENQPLMTVRMGVVEPTQNHWNQMLQEFFQPGRPTVFENKQNFQMFSVDFSRFFCPFIKSDFCENPAPLFDSRIFSYGWKIYFIPAGN